MEVVFHTNSSLYLRRQLHFIPPRSHPTRLLSLSAFTSLTPTPVAAGRRRLLRSLSSSAARPWRPLTVSSRAVAAEDVSKERFPADVRVTEIQEPQSRVRLTVEVPSSVCHECYKEALNEFARRSKVPGFRPGKKVPENILLNYIGKENVHQAAIEATLKRTLPRAMSSVEGRALKDSVRIVTKFSEMKDTFSLRDVFRYDVVADVAPEVKWLSEDKYKNLKIVVEIDDIIKTESASEKELRRRHKSLGLLRIVTDRGLEIGDLVVLDIMATTIGQDESEGEKIPSAERKGFHLDTEEGENLLPGFLDAIVGIRPGEAKSFPLQFPESWEQESLRGIRAQFTVVCKELFYRDLPELDDSIAEKLLPGCTTINQIVEVDIPKFLFEEQGRQLYGTKLLQLQVERRLSPQQLESLSSEKAVNHFLENEKESISKLVKQMLAVGEIFKCENLQYSTEELVKEVENSIEELKRHNQEYEEDRVKEQVQDVLEGAKVLEWLRENADIQYVHK